MVNCCPSLLSSDKRKIFYLSCENTAGMKLLLLWQAESAWSTPWTRTHVCIHAQSSAVGSHHLSPRAKAEGQQIVLMVFLQVPLLQTHRHTICPPKHCSQFFLRALISLPLTPRSSIWFAAIVSLNGCVLCRIMTTCPPLIYQFITVLYLSWKHSQRLTSLEMPTPMVLCSYTIWCLDQWTQCDVLHHLKTGTSIKHQEQTPYNLTRFIIKVFFNYQSAAQWTSGLQRSSSINITWLCSPEN